MPTLPPLDELYLTWLYNQVGDSEKKRPSYWRLLRKLFTIEFIWFIPNDDNRVEDGRELRIEFMHDLQLNIEDKQWLDLGCSVLEMLIGLSRRLSFEAEGEPRDWFWKLIENVGIVDPTDSSKLTEEDFEEIIDRVVWRRYNYDGTGGGLFPLRRADRDQREVEIWYQLNAYLLEHVA